jgi:putative cardiolipin synthase
MWISEPPVNDPPAPNRRFIIDSAPGIMRCRPAERAIGIEMEAESMMANKINSERVSGWHRAVVGGLGLLGVLLVANCTSLPTDYPKTVTSALKAPVTSGVGGIFEREARRHGGKSGFAVIPNNREAFTDRVALAKFAEKTLDVQYYIWSADTIGLMLGDEIVQAAERGVRVRFLLDDLSFKKRDSAAAALSAHPNIEVRIFNPAQHRSLRRIEFMANFGRMNKRMHNKIMVMDNAVAIIGGRNIADDYFGLGETQNNRDLDIAAVGPIVRDISGTFDEFWNSIAAVPIEALVKEEYKIEDFRKQVVVMRETMNPERYPFPLESDLKALRSRVGGMRGDIVWAHGRVLHDSIESMKKKGQGQTLVKSLGAVMRNARKELLIESAYFVVRDNGIEFTRTLTSRGVKVRVLTNSLASNNVLAAQAGHSKHRVALLDAGMDLYEFRPDAASVMWQVAPQGRDSVTTLHTKALVIDGQHAFVGSFNLDPRSADINSEIGLLVDSPVFARKVLTFLDDGIKPENAYHVTKDADGKVRWDTVVDGEPRTWSKDPETSGFKRFKEGFVELLPIQNQL